MIGASFASRQLATQVASAVQSLLRYCVRQLDSTQLELSFPTVVMFTPWSVASVHAPGAPLELDALEVLVLVDDDALVDDEVPTPVLLLLLLVEDSPPPLELVLVVVTPDPELLAVLAPTPAPEVPLEEHATMTMAGARQQRRTRAGVIQGPFPVGERPRRHASNARFGQGSQ